jgi:uncharacterized caspase-like protein
MKKEERNRSTSLGNYADPGLQTKDPDKATVQVGLNSCQKRETPQEKSKRLIRMFEEQAYDFLD